MSNGMGDYEMNGRDDVLFSPDGTTPDSAAPGANSADRISSLELLVNQQADDILCLKTALAEVIRRLQDVESSKLSSSGRMLSGKPASTPRSAAALPNKPANTSTSATRSSAPRNSLPAGKKPAKNGSMESLNSTHANATGANTGPTRTTKKIGNKDVTVEKGEGLAKMYLKGRAVTMYAPSEQKHGRTGLVGKEPDDALKLEWVYGYRGKDCRNNIVILSTDELCYFTAATVVMFDTATRKQRFYQEHTDDIKSIALHSDKVTVATGQVAGHAEVHGKPHVRVWNSETLTTLFVLGEGFFNRAVCCLNFSKEDGGDLLCAVDDSNEHVISIWDWKNEKKITEQKGSQDPVSFMEWHPQRNDCLVMGGKSCLLFWSLADGKLNKKSGLFDKYDKPKYVTCCAFTENKEIVLSGDSNGNLLVWNVDEHKVKDAVTTAHDGPIFALCALPNNQVLTGGSKDLLVSIFDISSMAKVRDVTTLPDNVGGVRHLVTKGDELVVGTTRNCILKGPLQTENVYETIMTSHFDELWGIAVHNGGNRFLTCGMDKLIIMWDAEKRVPLWTKSTDYQLMCASFHPTQNVALFGTACGKWFVLDLESKEIITLHPDSKEQFDCAAFSPDGNLLAVGSHDNGIYVYKVLDNARKYSKVGKCFGHTSFVTHIDWSCDSQYIRSNSGDYEILYWTANNCKQCIDVQSMRDQQFQTDTCVLGYNVMGIWPEGADGTDINGCDRSPNYNFVATADDFGKVKLFNYPCYTPRAGCKVGNAHSSHVTRVRFMPDSQSLLSTGGQDSSVMLWKIESSDTF